MSDVTNGERLATKQDLADMYQGILPYLGGMPEMLANKFSKGDLYSTDEKMIGQWIDGKPIYQKTWANIDVSGIIDGINHNIIDITNLNADTTIDIQAIGHQVTSSQKYDYISNYFSSEATLANSLKMNVWRRAGNYIGFNATNMSITSITVTFKYTKTTDSPISIGSDTDYSTEEKIVGTWIDGKPVYQKTYNGNYTISSASWTNIGETIINMAKIIFYSATLTSGTSIPMLVACNESVVQVKAIGVQEANLSSLTVQYTKTTT